MLNSQFKSGIGLRLEMNDYIYITRCFTLQYVLLING